jgi:hypothetical protein
MPYGNSVWSSGSAVPTGSLVPTAPISERTVTMGGPAAHNGSETSPIVG